MHALNDTFRDSQRSIASLIPCFTALHTATTPKEIARMCVGVARHVAEIEKSRNAGLEGPKKYISIRDQQALLNIDPRDVLTGKVEVSDD